MVEPMQKAFNLLPAYSAGQISIADREEVEALLTSYIDGLLDPVTEAAIDLAIENDAALAADIAKAQRGKAKLEALFPPSDEPLEDPSSPEIQKILDDLYAKLPKKPEPEAPPKVVPVVAKQPPPQPRRHWAIAATVAMALVGGTAWLYSAIQTRFDEAEQLRATLERQIEGFERRTADLNSDLNAANSELAAKAGLAETLQEDIESLTTSLAAAEQMLDVTSEQLVDANATIDRLSGDRTALEQRIVALETRTAEGDQQSARLRADLIRAETDLAKAEAERSEVLSTLAATEHEVALLEQQRAQASSELAAATSAGAAVKAMLVEATKTIDILQAERGDLDQQLAALADERDRLSDARLTGDQETARLEQSLQATRSDLADAGRQIAEMALDRLKLDTRLAEVSNNNWLTQVAQYHRGYAGQMEQRQVEIPALKETMLVGWLSEQLGREVSVPDLSSAGMTFIGGRLFFANGQPVGQIAYHDAGGELFAFCLTPNMSGKASEAIRSRYGDLNMVSWSDRTNNYVLVGWVAFDEMEAIASQL